MEPELLPLDCAKAMPEASISAIKKVLFMSLCSFDVWLSAVRERPLVRSLWTVMLV